MKRDVFEDLITQLRIPKNEWVCLSEVDSIILRNGRGIYPDWQHERFLIMDNGSILIKHGSSEPYGARLSRQFQMSWDKTDINFLPGCVVPPTRYYNSFRLPKTGDILMVTRNGKVIDTAIISMAIAAGNAFSIKASKPLMRMTTEDLLSFYDPKGYDEKTCVHGTEDDGIYERFNENSGHKTKFGIAQEKIRLWDIDRINLSISGHRKIYSVK